MKKIILSLVALTALLYAKPIAPKMGCILSQQGEVKANWTAYTSEKLGIQGKFDNVKYKAIAKEGKNFKAILVGSTIGMDTNSTNFKNKPLLLRLKNIQSKKRIKRGPRHGVIVFNISLNGVEKDVPMVYFYETGDMKIKGFIDLSDFKLADETTYVEIVVELSINSIVCALPHKK